MPRIAIKRAKVAKGAEKKLRRATEEFPIVGIGASAGGLAADEACLAHTLCNPPDD